MLERLREARFSRIAWLSILTYALHYAEEAPRFVSWIRSTESKMGRVYTQKKFRTENLLMFSFAAAGTALLNIFPRNKRLRIMALGSGVAFLENLLFHAIPTLRTGVYSPGVVTACLLNPALAIILFWKAREEGFLDARTVADAVVMGTLVLPAFVGFTHKVLLRDDAVETSSDIS